MVNKGKRLYEFGPFTLNATDCRLSCRGEEIRLEPKAFDLLRFFVSHADEVLSRQQIKLGVWDGVSVEDNNVDQRIAAVRRALTEHDGSVDHIENRPKRGWRFTPAVSARLETADAAEAQPFGAPTQTEPELDPPENPPLHYLSWLRIFAALGLAALGGWHSSRPRNRRC